MTTPRTRPTHSAQLEDKNLYLKIEEQMLRDLKLYKNNHQHATVLCVKSLPPTLKDLRKITHEIIENVQREIQLRDDSPFNMLVMAVISDLTTKGLRVRSLRMEVWRQRFLLDPKVDRPMLTSIFSEPLKLPTRDQLSKIFGLCLPSLAAFSDYIFKTGFFQFCLSCCSCDFGAHRCWRHTIPDGNGNIGNINIKYGDIGKGNIGNEKVGDMGVGRMDVENGKIGNGVKQYIELYKSTKCSMELLLNNMSIGKVKRLLLIENEHMPLDELLECVMNSCYRYSSFQFFIKESLRYYTNAMNPEYRDHFDLAATMRKNGRKSDIFGREILTHEFIDALATYLVKRSLHYERLEQEKQVLKRALKPVLKPVLEVGAGSGRLAYFLNCALKRMTTTLGVLATDLEPYEPRPKKFQVEKLSEVDAMRKYKPHIVLCSWMPFSEDWSATWRRECTFLEEYILIGEPMSCGRLWETYGCVYDDNHVSKTVNVSVPPFTADNWSLHILNDISKFQLTNFSLRHNCCTEQKCSCHTNSDTMLQMSPGIASESHDMMHCDMQTIISRTVSFRRQTGTKK